MSVRSARKLRKSMGPPEARLWTALRQRPGDFKFRRQHPIEGYVLDFFCHGAALAIEIDGMAHNMGDRPERDEVRDGMLMDLGIMTLRIPAIEVRDNLEAIVAMVVDVCRSRSPK